MFIPSSEQLGNIVARLVIADENFSRLMVEAAEKAGDRMLPEDVEHLQSWGRFMLALRVTVQNTEGKIGNRQ